MPFSRPDFVLSFFEAYTTGAGFVVALLPAVQTRSHPATHDGAASSAKDSEKMAPCSQDAAYTADRNDECEEKGSLRSHI